jgi:site-specific recombinase XerD
MINATNATNTGAIVALHEVARGYAKRSKADNTLRAYASQWSAFESFCRAHDCAALPATPQTVAAYIAQRALEGASPATISQGLAAIGEIHKLRGHASPRAHPIVSEVLSGIRRTHGTAPVKKAPVLNRDMKPIISKLPASLVGDRDKALMLVGFGGCLRRSELVALTVADVVWSVEGIVLTVRKSKADQEAKGRKVAIPYARHAVQCPCLALRTWLDAAGITEGPLFRSLARGKVSSASLSAQSVALAVKSAVRAMGVDPAGYAGHSLRSGFATSASIAGVPAALIQEHGGWMTSQHVTEYIRNGARFANNAANGLL